MFIEIVWPLCFGTVVPVSHIPFFFKWHQDSKHVKCVGGDVISRINIAWFHAQNLTLRV